MRLMQDIGFGTLNLNRIWLEVLEDNLGAIRAYEKAGYVLEGTQREATYGDGNYIGMHIMGVLKSEWQAQRK
jgi:RimJ/RimL family protein N-acetyltransferase